MPVRLPVPRVTRRMVKILAWVVGVALVLAGLAAWQVPKVVRSALTTDVAAMLGRDVSVGNISFNPFTLTLRAHDLAVSQPQGAAPLLRIGLIDVSAGWRSAIFFAPVIDRIRVVDPHAALVRDDVTHFNFSDIQQKLEAMAAAKPAPPPDADDALPRFSLNNLSLEGGQVTLDDKVTGRTHTIDRISLGVPFVSTFGYAADIDVQPRVHMRINGSAFDLDGVTRPFDKVPSSTLNVSFVGLELDKWADIWPLPMPVELHRGLLDSALQVRFEQPRDAAPVVRIVGDVGLRQFDLRETSGDALMAWSTLVLRRISAEPIARKLYVGEVELWSPQAQTRRYADQRINWLEVINDLQKLGDPRTEPATRLVPASRPDAAAPAPATGTAPPAATAPPPDPWHVVVDAVNLHDGELRLRDAGSGLDYQITGLGATVEGIELPQPKDRPMLVWLSMDNATDGGWLRAKGPLVLQPLSLDLDLQLANVALAPFAPAVRSVAPIVLQDGRMALNARLRLVQQGQVNVVSATAVQARLARLALRDESMKPAIDIRLGQLDLGVNQLSLGPQPASFTLNARDIQGKGTLALKGAFTTQPVSVKTQVDLAGLDLAAFAPYVASRLNATVRSVIVAARGEASYAGSGPSLAATWNGAVDVTDLNLEDRVNRDDFLKWSRLGLSGMQIAMKGSTLSANLGDILLDDFYGRVLLNAEGRLNVMDLVAEPGEAGGSITQDTQTRARADASAAAGAMPDISLSSVTLKRGRMTFTDRFIKPNYTAELSAIEGTVSAVSSRRPQPARVNVGGRVYTTAPFSISGTVQPFAQYLSLDLKASAKGVDLPRFTTYSAKYVGYPIKRGKLSMDVRYEIKNRALTASNRVVLNQLTFGDKTNSPDAIKAPVLLAVALLKDSRGNIDINLPISGSLDDPQFSVGGIIVRVLVNLVVKAVTSPFTLLASAFGGGEELSYVAFAPGSAELTPEGAERLDTLATALNDRPQLKLDVAGRADPVTDEAGLRQAWVDRQIRLAKARATAPRGKKPDPDGVTVSAAERARYLEAAYDDTKLENKPRNFIGLAKSIPASEMEALLRQAAPAGQDELRKLADLRAQAVYEKLQAAGPADRVFMVEPTFGTDGIKDDGPPSRVDFSLK
ncbi:hypothetical protein CEK29_04415 [Bordetella genomosp. 5]|uniref:DUF748 domain-containing protein n=1 Tax=Bordetella genomosp. 5 TaxID=1395608 RepID=UPI000B9E885F|nr:DUF748 domain-containing protein [Bordetella genomosp. 5]OZI46146.1 hypothetical protein CEK29_04415 [Bordetella genomosp. 5]